MHFVIKRKIKPAVRMTQRGKYVKKDAQEYLVSKDDIGYQLKQQMQEHGWTMLPDETPLFVRIVFHISRRMHGCDIDNLAKTVLDSAQGIAFKNDCWVDALNVYRESSEEYKTILTIWEYGE